MTVGERVKAARIRKGLTQEELAKKLGYKSRSSVNKIELERDIPRSMIVKLAEILEVTPSYIMGWDTPSEPSNISAVYDDHIRMVPVFESVSAGFGALAENSVVDFIPLRIVSDYEAAETICIRVDGDSMFPKIENGDIIQVHKQETVDDGDIAVLLIDGTEGVVKKVHFLSDGIELVSINPYYPPRRFCGEDAERVRIIGLVRGISRSF